MLSYLINAPFVIMLLAIAVVPLTKLGHLWEKPSIKLALSLFLGLPIAFMMWQQGHADKVVHSLVEYAQFVTLLGSLFVISGCIRVAGNIKASPKKNLMFLVVGGVLASVIGTTGAAMLLIRPLVETNKERKHKVHTVIFAILVIANCGGLLTPLGDPPLFLGMLRGVPFMWTFSLLPQWLMVNGLLILTYYALDKRMYNQESATDIARDNKGITPIRIDGKHNFLFLFAVVLSVAFAPSIDLHKIHEGHADLMAWVPVRELCMLIAASMAWFSTPSELREGNQFTWEPIQEVATLFIGIFLTMIPVLMTLNEIAPSLPMSTLTFFVLTGGLSAVLDNAPTYVTFFEVARSIGGQGTLIAGVPENFLRAISTGAVFCGALTYIGNGPNFMVKAVAESMKVKMPGFVGYMVQAVKYLVPVLVLMFMTLITESQLVQYVGWFGVFVFIAWKWAQIRATPTR